MPRFNAFIRVTNLVIEHDKGGVRSRRSAYTGRVVVASSIADAKRTIADRVLREFLAHQDVRNELDDPPHVEIEEIVPADSSAHDIGIVFCVEEDDE